MCFNKKNYKKVYTLHAQLGNFAIYEMFQFLKGLKSK